jgi:hypothetical protein
LELLDVSADLAPFLVVLYRNKPDCCLHNPLFPDVNNDFAFRPGPPEVTDFGFCVLGFRSFFAVSVHLFFRLDDFSSLLSLPSRV